MNLYIHTKIKIVMFKQLYRILHSKIKLIERTEKVEERKQIALSINFPKYLNMMKDVDEPSHDEFLKKYNNLIKS